jgi:hypothetical protein
MSGDISNHKKSDNYMDVDTFDDKSIRDEPKPAATTSEDLRQYIEQVYGDNNDLNQPNINPPLDTTAFMQKNVVLTDEEKEYLDSFN